MDDIMLKNLLEVMEGFYRIKYRPGCRWGPAELDGVAWDIGDGTGYDLYVMGPRIRVPSH